MQKNSLLKPHDYFIIFCLFFLAFFIQKYSFFNWDASWHLLAAKRILAGGASYTTNLYDDNLPMVFWFFIPAVFIQKYTNINLLLLCNLSVDLVIFISFLLCSFFLNQIYLKKQLLEKKLVLYLLLAILLIGPGYEFAQRDSLVITFLFPYIALIAAQIKSNTQKNDGVRVIVGLFAAIGICMNPFYALLIAILEMQRWIYQKKIQLITPELVSLIVIFLSYFTIMAIFYPDYFTVIVPAIAVFCGIHNKNVVDLLRSPVGIIFYVSSIVFFANIIRSKNQWFLSLWLAVFASFIIFLIHQKLWESHAVSVLLTANLLLATLIIDMLLNQKNRAWLALGIAIITFVFSVLFSIHYHRYCYHLFADKKSDTNQFIQFFNQQPKGSTLYLLSYELISTFSFLPYTTLNYLPPGPNVWTLVHIDSISPWGAKQQEIARQRIISDFQNKKPDFVLVDVSKDNQKFLPNFVSSLQKNSVFNQQWQKYQKVKKIGNYEIFAR